jgi:predicted RNA binding protein YcfA (HicA-like mRNA interferase family)
MCKLPRVSGQEAIKAFQRCGFQLDRIAGSHHILKRPGHRFVLAVPVHGKKPLAKGTLRQLLRGADLTVEQFLELLD